MRVCQVFERYAWRQCTKFYAQKHKYYPVLEHFYCRYDMKFHNMVESYESHDFRYKSQALASQPRRLLEILLSRTLRERGLAELYLFFTQPHSKRTNSQPFDFSKHHVFSSNLLAHLRGIYHRFRNGVHASSIQFCLSILPNMIESR